MRNGHVAWLTVMRVPEGLLNAANRRLIDPHLLRFVKFRLWSEYFSVVVGDRWLDAL
jgi:hypothetical protein